MASPMAANASIRIIPPTTQMAVTMRVASTVLMLTVVIGGSACMHNDVSMHSNCHGCNGCPLLILLRSETSSYYREAKSVMHGENIIRRISHQLQLCHSLNNWASVLWVPCTLVMYVNGNFPDIFGATVRTVRVCTWSGASMVSLLVLKVG